MLSARGPGAQTLSKSCLRLRGERVRVFAC